MRFRRGRHAVVGLLGLALLAGACTDDDDDAVVETGTGVTAEPCPNAVNDDNGCIYLGVLSDLTQGPFAAMATEAVEGQRDFWRRVNEQGGIDGYDIDIDRYTRDNEYDPEAHAAAYEEIEPEILALAQALGTPPTAGILEEMDGDDLVGVPVSWWSGWDFPDTDHGLLLGSGASYCLEAQVGLDWAVAELGDVGQVLSVGYAGGYGDDGAAGVEAWAQATGTEYGGFVPTDRNAVVGDQDGVVQALLEASPDVVHLGVGPAEAGEIVVKMAQRGFEGLFLGSGPSWNPVLLENPDAAQAMRALYRHLGPWEGFDGTSDAHAAMREVRGDDPPANDGYAAGWIASYPLRAALLAAAEDGDLTREGLRAAVDGLEVEYEGALPSRVYGGDPGEDAPRSVVVSAPDPDAPLGLTTLEAGVTGPTADEYDYAAPCSEPGG